MVYRLVQACSPKAVCRQSSGKSAYQISAATYPQCRQDRMRHTAHQLRVVVVQPSPKASRRRDVECTWRAGFREFVGVIAHSRKPASARPLPIVALGLVLAWPSLVALMRHQASWLPMAAKFLPSHRKLLSTVPSCPELQESAMMACICFVKHKGCHALRASGLRLRWPGLNRMFFRCPRA